MIASYHGHVRCVELLITAGAAVDVQEKVFYRDIKYSLFECLFFYAIWFQVTNASKYTRLVRDRIFLLSVCRLYSLVIHVAEWLLKQRCSGNQGSTVKLLYNIIYSTLIILLITTRIDNHDSGYLGMAVQLYVQAHLGHYHILTQKDNSQKMKALKCDPLPLL